MKHRTVIIMLIFSIALLHAQSVIFNTSEWEPYTTAKPGGKAVVTEIIMAACSAGNIAFDLRFFPWERCEQNVQNGMAFAAFPYRITEERSVKYYFPDVLITSRGGIFYWEGRGSDIDWLSLKDFGNVRWGGLQGYWYRDELKKLGIKYDSIATTEQAILMLKSGRIQYFIEDELVCKMIAERILGNEIGKLKMFTKPANMSTLHLIVSRQYPDSRALLDQFNKGLAIIKRNGVYAGILKKYGIKY